MNPKHISIRPLHDPDAAKRDLEYWLGKTPEERIEAVDILRRHYYGDLLHKPMARVFRIINRKTGEIIRQSEDYHKMKQDYLTLDSELSNS